MISNNLDLYNFKKTQIKTLTVSSEYLRNNSLSDRSLRQNPVVIPRDETAKWPVVLILAGFGSNSPNYFSPKPFGANAVEVLCQAIDFGEAPLANYVFVDAFTQWGGSQFINSKSMGRYEDYIVQELVEEVKEKCPAKKEPQYWCITGGSSGGYGALHLASSYPEKFGLVAAVAPDSFFEMSLLPELLAVKPLVDKMGGALEVSKELASGRFFRRKGAHKILNALAMGLCYADNSLEQFDWPFDELGQVDESKWKIWKKHDPLCFLPERIQKLKMLEQIYLDVGKQDQFFLQYGARKIQSILNSSKIKSDYSEFDGDHFDIGDRRIEVWRWLNRFWSPQ